MIEIEVEDQGTQSTSPARLNYSRDKHVAIAMQLQSILLNHIFFRCLVETDHTIPLTQRRTSSHRSYVWSNSSVFVLPLWRSQAHQTIVTAILTLVSYLRLETSMPLILLFAVRQVSLLCCSFIPLLLCVEALWEGASMLLVFVWCVTCVYTREVVQGYEDCLLVRRPIRTWVRPPTSLG